MLCIRTERDMVERERREICCEGLEEGSPKVVVVSIDSVLGRKSVHVYGTAPGCVPLLPCGGALPPV